MSIKSAVSWSFAINIVTKVVNLLAIVYFANVLSAHLLGTFFLFQTILGFATLFTDFGMRGALEKRISEGEQKGEILGTTILIKAVLIVLITAICFLGKPYLTSYIGINVIILLIVSIISLESFNIINHILKGELRVKYAMILQGIQVIGWVFISVILYHSGQGIYSLIYGLIGSYILCTLLGIIAISTFPTTPTNTAFWSIYEYAKYNAVSDMNWYLHNWLDIAIIGLFLTPTAVSAYEIAWRIASVARLMPKAIGTASFPQISQWHSQGEMDNINNLINKSIVPSLVLAIPIFMGSVITARPLIEYIFGTEYTIAGLALTILLAQKVVYSIYFVLSRLLHGINKPKAAAKAKVISVLVNLGLNLPLVYYFGITGAAVATTISFLANTWLIHSYLNTSIEITFPNNKIAWMFISSIIMVSLLYGSMTTVPITSIQNLVIYILFGAVIYSFVLVQYTPLRSDIWSALPTRFQPPL